MPSLISPRYDEKIDIKYIHLETNYTDGILLDKKIKKYS